MLNSDAKRIAYRDKYNAACRLLVEKLEARRGEWKVENIDLSRQGAYGQFSENNPSVEELVVEVERDLDLDFEMSSYQCSLAVAAFVLNGRAAPQQPM